MRKAQRCVLKISPVQYNFIWKQAIFGKIKFQAEVLYPTNMSLQITIEIEFLTVCNAHAWRIIRWCYFLYDFIALMRFFFSEYCNILLGIIPIKWTILIIPKQPKEWIHKCCICESSCEWHGTPPSDVTWSHVSLKHVVSLANVLPTISPQLISITLVQNTC